MEHLWNAIYSKKMSLNKYPWDKIVSFIFKYYPKEASKRKDVRILELGFGSGCNLWFCAREGFDCYGIEISQEAIEHATTWFNEEKLDVKLYKSSFSPLVFKDNFFDIIIDRASLACVSLDDCKVALNEVFRVLKPGACFHFNPYSSKHTSAITGEKKKNGMTKITEGRLQGVGDLQFFNCEQIRKMSKEVGFSISNIRHTEDQIVDDKNRNDVHAEWIAILRKPDESK